MTPNDPRDSRRTILWIVYSVVTVLAVLAAGEALFRSYRHMNLEDADIKNDWVVASALVAGDNPYRDLGDLAERHADGRYSPPAVDPSAPQPGRTPRTPGAILLAIPLLLIPFDDLVRVTSAASALLTVPTIGLALWPNRNPLLLGLSLAVLVSTPMLWSFRFGSVSVLVAFLIIGAVVAMERDRPGWAGLAIAVATSLKLYPSILLVVAASRRSLRTVVCSLSAFALLNAVPLLLPNIVVSDAIDALAGAASRYSFIWSNISITALLSNVVGSLQAWTLSVVIVVGLSALVYRRPSRTSVDALLLVSVATLLAPLSWPHYALALFPLALHVYLEEVTGRVTRGALVVGSIVSIATVPIAIEWPVVGIWYTAVGMAILALAAGIERLREAPTPLSRLPLPLAARASAR